jgi:hypothetical protein
MLDIFYKRLMRSATSKERRFNLGKASMTATPLRSVVNWDSRGKLWASLVFWSNHCGPVVREQLLAREFIFILVFLK